MSLLYRGDDTDAFENEFLTIELEEAPENIKKAEFRCGAVVKEYKNPVFPLKVSLNSSETMALREENNCYLAVYDQYGRKWTCEGTISVGTQCRKV